MRQARYDHERRPAKMDNPPTPAELMLWKHLTTWKHQGYKFFRQYPIGAYVVDFFCPRLRLVIEIDGESHAHQVAYDQRRTAYLEAQGLKVVRFWNSEVYESLEGVLETIYQYRNAGK